MQFTGLIPMRRYGSSARASTTGAVPAVLLEVPAALLAVVAWVIARYGRYRSGRARGG